MKDLDKYVEEKARELIDKIDDVYPALRSITYWENFVISIVEDCKPKVGSKAIGKMVKKYFNTTHPEIINHGIKEMLEEVGLEVEGC